ncbi:hypothetical protein [Methylobacterium radiotolerans]|uniref:hypothetical protein n=1 Tax=Methylobacterium radiotolerans TaxID=31998 RepID=UPI001F30F830|nr:hypothetical protein [Methylobacterium radiotolerans]UIY45820.1 hypothetical protein LZ599_32455 [Methylobacterium radiotolerans]
MSTFRRFTEAAAAAAYVISRPEVDRYTVVLALKDAQALGINPTVRLAIHEPPGTTVAHYTDAGQCQHQAGYWREGDETGAMTPDEIRDYPALAAIALVAADRRHREEAAAIPIQ